MKSRSQNLAFKGLNKQIIKTKTFILSFGTNCVIWHMKKPNPTKKRVWLRVDEDILNWIYKKIKDKKYASESHAFEALVMEKIKEEKNE